MNNLCNLSVVSLFGQLASFHKDEPSPLYINKLFKNITLNDSAIYLILSFIEKSGKKKFFSITLNRKEKPVLLENLEEFDKYYDRINNAIIAYNPQSLELLRKNNDLLILNNEQEYKFIELFLEYISK